MMMIVMKLYEEHNRIIIPQMSLKHHTQTDFYVESYRSI